MKYVVEISNLKKYINGNCILNDINIQFEKGKIYGIVGRNGSGKSIMFKIMCGFINPSEGQIKVFDKIIDNGEFPNNTGIIIESPGFLPQYSALKNLSIIASIKNKISEKDIKDTLSLVGLNPLDKRPVKKYSLGMKQRLGIAQAIMENPKLLILDEPMNGLDSEGINSIRNILLDYKSKGITIILASHNEDDINILCDEIITLENGSIKRN